MMGGVGVGDNVVGAGVGAGGDVAGDVAAMAERWVSG